MKLAAAPTILRKHHNTSKKMTSAGGTSVNIKVPMQKRIWSQEETVQRSLVVSESITLSLENCAQVMSGKSLGMGVIVSSVEQAARQVAEVVGLAAYPSHGEVVGRYQDGNRRQRGPHGNVTR